VRCYKVLGIYDDMIEQGTVIREDRDSFKLMLDLTKHDKAAAAEALQAIISRLKD
jgi:hypothetical protein